MASVTATESRMGTGWMAALRGAVVSLVIAFAICAGLVAWAHPTFPDTDDHARRRFQEVFPVFEGAGASMLGFQRVPITLDRQELPGSRRPTEHLTYRVVGSPLGGLLLIGMSLAIGGAITRRRSGRRKSPIVGAARMAVLFAAACFGLSFILPHGKSLTAQGPFVANAFTLAYRPSHLAALLWPFVWGLLFGTLGAFIGEHGRRWRQELIATIEARSRAVARAVRAAAAGLATGIALILLAGILTAIVGVATHSSEAGQVLGSAKNVMGITEGVVIGLPHATGAGLIAAMGVPAHFEAADLDGESGEYATADIFGGERQQRDRAFDTSGPSGPYPLAIPRYALGGLIIAIAITVVTGYRAATGSGSATETARSVVLAAGFLTVALWIIAYLISAKLRIELDAGSPRLSGVRMTLRPSILEVLVLPAIWTLAGGTLGALLHQLRRRTRPA
ncbi:MAG: hypothetical protein WEB06_16175 [Actinomycetota bacterium]